MQKLAAYLLTSPAVIISMLYMGSAVRAEIAPTVNELQLNNSHEEVMAQTTSVSQFSDVQPRDWAFKALQSLIERYGCINGFPDNTFRGNRVLTRYEFAAALNGCLDRVNELIATTTNDVASKQDIATIKKLQNDFSPELATLRGRVNTLEAKTAELEANQFSTTTKLQGQVVAVVSGIVKGKKVAGADITDKNTTLAARTRVEFVSSFTGRDTLLTRLESNNIKSPDINTPEGNLFFASGSPSNSVGIGTLSYAFPVSKNTQVKLIATGGAADDLTNTVNILDGDAAFGALSTFGTRNPIYGQLNGAGLALNHQFGDKLALSLGYLSPTANDPTVKNGLFNGSYGALAQLTVKPRNNISLGLTYINSYNLPLVTGSNNATSSILIDNFSTNSYGVQASLGISKNFVLGGWAGYTNSQVLTGSKGKFDTQNYAITLALPDLGKKGNLAGLIVGMEPKVTSSSANGAGVAKDPNTSYHIEGFYQYKLSDNITITPAVIWLTAPDHNKDSGNVVIGALRTTFSF